MPNIVIDCFRAHPEISVTNIQKPTRRTSALYKSLSVFELTHTFITGVKPDRAKSIFADISKRIALPKLVRVDIALSINIGNADTGTVSAIAAQKL